MQSPHLSRCKAFNFWCGEVGSLGTRVARVALGRGQGLKDVTINI